MLMVAKKKKKKKKKNRLTFRIRHTFDGLIPRRYRIAQFERLIRTLARTFGVPMETLTIVSS